MKNKIKINKEKEMAKTKMIAKEFLKPLSGKQKRTTINLTKQGEDSLNNIRSLSKKKINSIIDNLSNNFADEKSELSSVWTDMVIAHAKKSETENKYEIRKSVVLSDKSLKILNTTAKKHQISRDSLIDSGFQTISGLMKYENEETLEKHEEALKKINRLWSEMEKVEKELKTFLEEDDPILEGLGYAIVHIMNLSVKIDDELKNGTPIDPESSTDIVIQRSPKN